MDHLLSHVFLVCLLKKEKKKVLTITLVDTLMSYGF